MNPAAAEARGPSAGRWLLYIGFVLAVQVLLIFLLGDHSEPQPKRPAAVPSLRVANPAYSEWLALGDPTLFALPHWRGFSGPAWLQKHPIETRSFEWKEEPQYLGLPATDSVAQAIAQDKNPEPFQIPLVSDEEPSLPPLLPPMFRQHSELRLEGTLASVKLLSKIDLRSWTNAETLTNTVVSLAVNAEGSCISSTILSKSGYAPADQFAMAQAKTARFAPAASSSHSAPGNWRWGTMTFIWRTEIPPPTNSPAIQPQK